MSDVNMEELECKLKAIGVAIKYSDGSYRPFEDIITDLALSNLKDLNEKDKLEIINALVGEQYMPKTEVIINSLG